ncbi:hypothetical protein DFJ73DRAFT_840771 [Zopfochytrium polystomum]|nr:hypothetical protein DFJ73DRAFT_840771 [Zopfochytrium polystomum]
MALMIVDCEVDDDDDDDDRGSSGSSDSDLFAMPSGDSLTPPQLVGDGEVDTAHANHTRRGSGTPPPGRVSGTSDAESPIPGNKAAVSSVAVVALPADRAQADSAAFERLQVEEQGGGPPAHVAPAAEAFSSAGGGELAALEGESLSSDFSAFDGFFRLLFLHQEKAGSGLVEKIILDQSDFGRLANRLHPGAYRDVTKIDFKALDIMSIQIAGLYGSRAQIQEFFLQKLSSRSPFAEPNEVAAGLYYYLANDETGSLSRALLIYWPEETTWKKQPASNVTKHRVTFMRFLSKLANQVYCLAADEDAKEFDLHKPSEDMTVDVDFDEDFTFEVSKSQKQEEAATLLEGFSIALPPSQGMKHLPGNAEGLPVDEELLAPRVIPGSTRQGVLFAKFLKSSMDSRPGRYHSEEAKKMLRNSSLPLRLSPTLNEQAVDHLLENGLKERIPELCKQWREEKSARDVRFENDRNDIERKVKDLCETKEGEIRAFLSASLSKEMLKSFDDHFVADQSGVGVFDFVEEELFYLNEALKEAQEQAAVQSAICLPKPLSDPNHNRLNSAACSEYQRLRKRAQGGLLSLTSEPKLTSDEIARIDDWVIDTNTKHSLTGLWSEFLEWVKSKGKSMKDMIDDANLEYGTLSHREFLDRLRASPFQKSYERILVCLQNWYESAEAVFWKKLIKTVQNNYRKSLTNKTKEAHSQLCAREFQKFCEQLVPALSHGWEDSPRRFTLTKVQESITFRQFMIEGQDETHSPHRLQYFIRQICASADDKINLELQHDYKPSPQLGSPLSFTTDAATPVRFIHFLNELIVLVLDDGNQKSSVYVERPEVIEAAVRRHTAKKQIHHDRLGGPNFIMACSEHHKLVAVVGANMKLIVFKYMESLGSLVAYGQEFDLSPWYPPGENGATVEPSGVCFAGDLEEVCILDNLGKVRMFSLVAQQMRPASVILPTRISKILASPDNSCLLGFQVGESGETIARCIFWASFGIGTSIEFVLPSSLNLTALAIGGLCHRSVVFFFSLDSTRGTLNGARLKITSSLAEYQFKMASESDHTMGSKGDSSVSSSLVDVWTEVWSRFPVVPAISRDNLNGSLQPTAFVVINSSVSGDQVGKLWSAMIRKFEESTKKPTGGVLSHVKIHACGVDEFVTVCPWSSFKMGEWLLELICLLPMQLAVCRDNRFIPLKNGVFSHQTERNLLGADVSTIVSYLSLGWYESLFAYYAHLPVQVVSSMGEQSVGKSYALNHLADTSFAGSAMRTTEGVWMSVAPTRAVLLVCLDFEGVHSVERSQQEDTLLVLFNAAISNLVLFRNNFALSRNVTELFSSFQSSATILDPESNKQLFNSRLVIVVKDVVPEDRKEIVKEFSSKLARIVSMEQEDNFVSKLFSSKMSIVPWPVIQSPRFYQAFGRIAKMLQEQPHYRGAAVFSTILKTLMAKLKVCDWGSFDSNLVQQRVAALRAGVPSALLKLSCVPETEGWEPLRNLDTNLECGPADEPLFKIPLPTAILEEKDRALKKMVTEFARVVQRDSLNDDDWMKDLRMFVSRIIEQRVEIVRQWIFENLARFPSDGSDVESFRREFSALSVDFVTGIEVCGATCPSCLLRCTLLRRHELEHDCGTDHVCNRICDFSDEHDGDSPFRCGLRAGHQGHHFCDVKLHRCGVVCPFSHHQGCGGSCTKPAKHEESDHRCDSAIHQCGQPCSLQEVRTKTGKISCTELCTLPMETEHQHHRCANISCPMTCALCNRRCDTADHFHALSANALHLCGLEHSCPEQCEDDGVCEIQIQPQAVESTYTGSFGSFQYTKYSQVSRKLKCAKIILPGELTHEGRHTHSTADTQFHYCTAQCPSCDYFCTLPFDHSQSEHDTSHGNMENTKWAVESDVQLQGHKFAGGDGGAPMLCNLVCGQLGRHVHFDYCRPGMCEGHAEVKHLQTRIEPEPNRDKDMISHSMFWKRLGFRDPYPRDQQNEFMLCDAACGGDDHGEDKNGTASFCTQPLFHEPAMALPPTSTGYLSMDGHIFNCRNPAVSKTAYHILFVLDRSGSMGSQDCLPDPSPVQRKIAQSHQNRLGAVYSSCYSFWKAREAMSKQIRHDAYSVILFNESPQVVVENDFTSTADQLLDRIIPYTASGGTSFQKAAQLSTQILNRNMTGDREFVLVLLSDGEDLLPHQETYDLCRIGAPLGKPVILYTVGFGRQDFSSLRGMANIANEVYRSAQPSVGASSPCGFYPALDQIALTTHFLELATSLTKPRASLMPVRV